MLMLICMAKALIQYREAQKLLNAGKEPGVEANTRKTKSMCYQDKNI